jgi:hypothetical protein
MYVLVPPFGVNTSHRFCLLFNRFAFLSSNNVRVHEIEFRIDINVIKIENFKLNRIVDVAYLSWY